MISPDYCRLMATYNAWMNERLYRVCGGLSDEERKADRELFFGSVHSTLNHLLFADIAWLCRFRSEPPDLPPFGDDLYSDYEELHQARKEQDDRIISWASAVSENWLAQICTYTSKLDGKTRSKPNWHLVTHLFNHETHHRGQITAALSQLGRDYGDTDLPVMPEQ